MLRLGLELIRCRMAFGQSLLGALTNRTALVWTDTSEFIFSPDGAVSITTTRGRKSPLIEFEPAGVRLLLDDSLGYFDPAMTTGPPPYVVDGVSQCQPGVPIWLDLPASGTGLAADEPVFLGVIEQFPASRVVDGVPTVEIQCWDLLRPFDLAPMRAVLSEQQTDERVWATLDAANFPDESVTEPFNRVLYTAGTGGASTCVLTRLEGHTATEHIANVVRTEGHNAFATVDKRGDFIFADRHAVFSAPFTDVVAVFGQAPNELPYMDIRWSSGESYIYNQIECSLAGGSGGARVSIVHNAVLAGADFITLPPGSELEGDIPAGAHIDFGTGRVVRVRLNASEGNLAIAIDPITELIRAGQAEYNGALAIAADNASQMLYGKRRLSRSGLLCPSMTTAQAMAEDLLIDFKDPHPRVESIHCSGIYQDDLSEALVQLAIGNRVTIRDHPKYSDEPIEMDMLIQGIEHSVWPRDWVTDLLFSPVPEPRSFWMLTNVEATTGYLSNAEATNELILNF